MGLLSVFKLVTTEINLADYFRANGMSYEGIPASTSDETQEGLESGRCDTLTTDASALASQRSALADPSVDYFA